MVSKKKRTFKKVERLTASTSFVSSMTVPSEKTFRGGDRVIVGEGSPSEEKYFKDGVMIDNPMEFDRSHDGFVN